MNRRSRFTSVHASNEQEYLAELKKLDEKADIDEKSKARQRRRILTDDNLYHVNQGIDKRNEYDGFITSNNKENIDENKEDCYYNDSKIVFSTPKKEYENEYYSCYKGDNMQQMEMERKKSLREYSDEDYYEIGHHKGKEYIEEQVFRNKVEMTNQYFLDNDQFLGRDNAYNPNIIKAKTEEEDLQELESLIETINKAYKKGDSDESSYENCADILCRYFKINIMLSTSEEKLKMKNSLLYLHDIKSFKLHNKKNDDLNLIKKSMSFNSITDINLGNLINHIITKKKKSKKSSSIKLKYSTLTDNYNPVLSKSTIIEDDLKGIIYENTEIDEIVKILLIGDKMTRHRFFRALKHGDSNININEMEVINDGIGSLDIIKEKVDFYDKILLLHFFSTNAAFYTNQLSKTYFKISHSIIILVDMDSQSSIDNFFFIYNKISELGEESKVSLLVWNSSNRSTSFDIELELRQMNSNFRLSIENSGKKKSVKERGSVNTSEGKSNLNAKRAKFKAFIKIYKLLMLQIQCYTEISMNNQPFHHFIGFQLLNKLKTKQSKVKGKEFKEKNEIVNIKEDNNNKRFHKRTFSYK